MKTWFFETKQIAVSVLRIVCEMLEPSIVQRDRVQRMLRDVEQTKNQKESVAQMDRAAVLSRGAGCRD